MPNNSHYTKGGISPVEYILANGWGFLLGNILKYLHRFLFKGTPIEDLDKAAHYLQILREDVIENPEKYGLTKDQVRSNE